MNAGCRADVKVVCSLPRNFGVVLRKYYLDVKRYTSVLWAGNKKSGQQPLFFEIISFYSFTILYT